MNLASMVKRSCYNWGELNQRQFSLALGEKNEQCKLLLLKRENALRHIIPALRHGYAEPWKPFLTTATILRPV
jgi:hypothetical protein